MIVSWLIDENGDVLGDDLFDGATLRKYRWSAFDPDAEARLRARRSDGDRYVDALHRYFDYRLERALRVDVVDAGARDADPLRAVRRQLRGDACAAAGGARRHEDRRADVSGHGAQAGVRYDELMLDPGAGRVAKPSLVARDTLEAGAPQLDASFLPLAYYFFLCGGSRSAHVRRELSGQPPERPAVARPPLGADAAAEAIAASVRHILCYRASVPAGRPERARRAKTLPSVMSTPISQICL